MTCPQLTDEERGLISGVASRLVERLSLDMHGLMCEDGPEVDWQDEDEGDSRVELLTGECWHQVGLLVQGS